MPEVLSSKSGFTRTATLRPRAGRGARSRPARAISRSDSTLSTMPAATARSSSARRLAGPGEADEVAARAGSRARRCISRAEATSRPSTSGGHVAHDAGHRVRLHRVVQMQPRPAAPRAARRRGRVMYARDRRRRTACGRPAPRCRVTERPPTVSSRRRRRRTDAARAGAQVARDSSRCLRLNSVVELGVRASGGRTCRSDCAAARRATRRDAEP